MNVPDYGEGCGAAGVPLLQKPPACETVFNAPPAYSEVAEIRPYSAGWSTGQASKLPFKDSRSPADNLHFVPTATAVVVGTSGGQGIVQHVQLQQLGSQHANTSGPQASDPPIRTFRWHIAWSCCVTWCLCWPIGLIAFILAMWAAGESKKGYASKARRLGLASCILSGVGAVVGVIALLLFITFYSRTAPE